MTVIGAALGTAVLHCSTSNDAYSAFDVVTVDFATQTTRSSHMSSTCLFCTSGSREMSVEATTRTTIGFEKYALRKSVDG